MSNPLKTPKAKALENYETVKERKKRFYEKFSDGRIVAECIRADDKGALFKATVFKNAEEQSKSIPLATGFAQEIKGQGSFANNTSWTENCEESAVGRALDNAGFSGNNKCSREEIEQAEKNATALLTDVLTGSESHQLENDPLWKRGKRPLNKEDLRKAQIDDYMNCKHRNTMEDKFYPDHYRYCFDCKNKVPKVG